MPVQHAADDFLLTGAELIEAKILAERGEKLVARDAGGGGGQAELCGCGVPVMRLPGVGLGKHRTICTATDWAHIEARRHGEMDVR